MKRDMDLVREILLRIEAHPKLWYPISEFADHDLERIQAHITWLCEAGLLRSDAHTDLLLGGYSKPERVRLTSAGHEFLDAARDDTLWNKAKTVVIKETGGLTLELLRAFLSAQGRQLLGLPL